MTQETKLFEKEEIEQMFDNYFLPKIQEISQRAKEKKLKDQDVRFFQVNMKFQFNPQEDILKYSDIEDKIWMQIQPITQEDLDRSKEELSSHVEEN